MDVQNVSSNYISSLNASASSIETSSYVSENDTEYRNDDSYVDYVTQLYGIGQNVDISV